MDAPLFPGFTRHLIEVAPGVNINTITAGSGAPLLLLHGHPQTHAIWHKVAPELATRFTVDAFDPRALAEYARCLASPGAAHGLCEDYRAAAGIDLEHDRDDRAHGRTLAMPLLVLWGARGVIQRCFEPLAEWRQFAADVSGHALPCGHYVPEEAPADLLDAALPFLST